MAIVMDMSNYQIERDSSRDAGYGDEIACTGWNPAVELACQQYALTEKRTAMPVELVNIDAEQFLQRMYARMR